MGKVLKELSVFRINNRRIGAKVSESQLKRLHK